VVTPLFNRYIVVVVPTWFYFDLATLIGVDELPLGHRVVGGRQRVRGIGVDCREVSVRPSTVAAHPREEPTEVLLLAGR